MSSSSSSVAAALLAPPVLRIRPPPAWTPEEDALLERLAREHGSRHWRRVASSLLTGRSARQCRDRWRHHLARDVYHRPFTARDDDDLARLYVRHAGRWRDISRAVHGRTSRAMRRRWMELRDSDALLSKMWRPHQDAPLGPGTESSSSQQQPLTFTCAAGIVVC